MVWKVSQKPDFEVAQKQGKEELDALLLPVQNQFKPLLERLTPKYPSTDVSEEQ